MLSIHPADKHDLEQSDIGDVNPMRIIIHHS